MTTCQIKNSLYSVWHNFTVDVKTCFIYLSKLQFTVGSSILLMRTIRCLTPAVLANIACSRVWPPFSKPVSNSPFLAEITWEDQKKKKKRINPTQKTNKKNRRAETTNKKYVITFIEIVKLTEIDNLLQQKWTKFLTFYWKMIKTLPHISQTSRNSVSSTQPGHFTSHTAHSSRSTAPSCQQ